MDSDDDKRVNYYRSASPEAQKLYGDEELGNTLYAIFSKHALPKEKYSSFVDVFGDTIIGLESSDTIPARLMAYVGLTQVEAENITLEVINTVRNPFLTAPLPRTPVGIPMAVPTPTAVPTPPQIPAATSLPSTPAPVSVPPPAPTSLPASRVMPKNETELPGTLLQNLKASLAHEGAGVAYVEEETPKPSYGAILDNGGQK